MVETFDLEFEDWTAYDEWLVANYENNSIFEVNEKDGKIKIRYCKKSDFPELKKELVESK